MTEEISNELSQSGTPSVEQPEPATPANAEPETAQQVTEGSPLPEESSSSDTPDSFDALLFAEPSISIEESPSPDAPPFCEASSSEAAPSSEPSSSPDGQTPSEASPSPEALSSLEPPPPSEASLPSEAPPFSEVSSVSDAFRFPNAEKVTATGSFAPSAESLAATAVPSSSDASPPLRFFVSALSDMGCVRKNNEDSFGYDEGVGIFVVCDGMGGMASGEVASSRAVAAIVNTYAKSASSDMPVSARLLHSLNMANQDVWENGQIPENKGMGTTAVVAALDGDKLILGNVGDSRAYVLQDGQCVQLTVDHSYINELIRNGTLTIENAHSANLQGYESVITRAIGVATHVEPDFFSIDLKPGTAVLLATDGLTRYVLQDEIAAILMNSPLERACANLIDTAKQRGGQDNITCILIVVSN
jgi:protein phosphatase